MYVLKRFDYVSFNFIIDLNHKKDYLSGFVAQINEFEHKFRLFYAHLRHVFSYCDNGLNES